MKLADLRRRQRAIFAPAQVVVVSSQNDVLVVLPGRYASTLSMTARFFFTPAVSVAWRLSGKAKEAGVPEAPI